MAPVTLKLLLTKTWCGQLILMYLTAYEPSLNFSTRLTVPPRYLASSTALYRLFDDRPCSAAGSAYPRPMGSARVAFDNAELVRIGNGAPIPAALSYSRRWKSESPERLRRPST
jgi:hypothetical protein